MRIDLTWLAIALTVAVATTDDVGAQRYSQGWFVAGANGVATVTPAGVVTTTNLGPQAIISATMAPDNRTVLAFDASLGAVVQIDPVQHALVGTIFGSPAFFSPFHMSDLTVDGDGALVFANRVDHTIERVLEAGSTSTLRMAAGIGEPFYTPRNIHYDVDTADLLVSDGQTTLNTPLFRLEPDGSAFTTVATGFEFRFGIARDPNTGAIYSGSCCNGTTGRSIEVLDLGQSTPRVWHTSTALAGGYSIAVERASAANPRLLVAAWDGGTSEGLWSIDVTSGVPQKLGTLGIGDAYRVVPIGSRTLRWRPLEANRWAIDVQVTDPALAGRPYVLALGVSGTRPGVPLADGRRIPLTVDAITFSSVANRLGGLLSGAVGVLAGGQATATLDLTPIGGRALTFRVWAQALVLDPAAPLGIALITDPAVNELTLR